MARETRKRMIDGTEWVTTQWKGRHLLKYQAELGRLLAPIAAMGAQSGGSMLDVDLTSAVGVLVNNLDSDRVVDLILGMLSTTNAGGDDLSNEALFDDHFAANSKELFQGLLFVLEVNMPDFFGEGGLNIGGLFDGLKAENSPAS